MGIENNPDGYELRPWVGQTISLAVTAGVLVALANGANYIITETSVGKLKVETNKKVVLQLNESEERAAASELTQKLLNQQKIESIQREEMLKKLGKSDAKDY